MTPTAKSRLRHPAFDRLGVAFGEPIERRAIQSKLCVEVFWDGHFLYLQEFGGLYAVQAFGH